MLKFFPITLYDTYKLELQFSVFNLLEIGVPGELGELFL
jgi:hypothetical protein